MNRTDMLDKDSESGANLLETLARIEAGLIESNRVYTKLLSRVAVIKVTVDDIEAKVAKHDKELAETGELCGELIGGLREVMEATLNIQGKSLKDAEGLDLDGGSVL